MYSGDGKGMVGQEEDKPGACFLSKAKRGKMSVQGELERIASIERPKKVHLLNDLEIIGMISGRILLFLLELFCRNQIKMD